MIDSKEISLLQRNLKLFIALFLVSLIIFFCGAKLSYTHPNIAVIVIVFGMLGISLTWTTIKDEAYKIHKLRNSPCTDSRGRNGNVYYVDFSKPLRSRKG